MDKIPKFAPNRLFSSQYIVVRIVQILCEKNYEVFQYDHHVIVLEDRGREKGPKVFRFQLYWLNDGELLPKT